MRKNLSFGDSYELIERPDGILIRPAKPIRAGWLEAAQTLKAEGMTEEEKMWANDGNNNDLEDEWEW
ncbi:AbrB/MazE/SpoVT family DNA-binding domain-containing protein [Piscirickettsia salmonis]|nr:AbrB/MazE/SpoVT family DNA-binding domain-containing protein [Piscirickettsia salmonis]QHS34172.1 AbrB/MazE/SpoVT family DNA-binding domain-containing protein [Piscirickettsia salmonis]QIX57525.1 AbrB/MazE/SpoVT family DNA-binding domain-containing protein [Piscirickettsia salmonis]QNR82643.1 AbrB/MazE/SpoVT family DNA-binding domain-containing protein [Piscirickettsia salmonis]WGZ73355.1 AbrB/MazE/SpoVT family DNA-binding domain-containing protein [Piscirickettsia salmonis]